VAIIGVYMVDNSSDSTKSTVAGTNHASATQTIKGSSFSTLVSTPTPIPTYTIAYIESEGFTVDPTTNTIYQLNGKVYTSSGRYDNVEIILRYPNNEEFSQSVGGMGGANATVKEFKVILNDRVKKLVPDYFIKLNGKEYPAEMDSTDSSTIAAYSTI